MRRKCLRLSLVISFFILAAFLVGYLRYQGWLVPPLTLGEGVEPTIETENAIEVWSLENQPKYIKDLIWCESRGNPKARGDGGKAYGLLQFHLPTAWAYNEKYKVLPNLEEQELLNVIEDPYFQVELAKKIILDGGWQNWYNCGQKVELYEITLKTP